MPLNKLPINPDPTQLNTELKRDIFKDLNCAQIGVIKSFDASDQSATIQIAMKRIVEIQDDGTKVLEDYPLILKCPVVFPSGGGFTLTFPVSDGDECLVVFADRGIDNWFVSGSGQQPASPRKHDINDAIAIVGVRSNPRALDNVSTTSAQIRTDDGSSFVEVNAEGVKVHAGTVYSWDCHGYGEKWTWTGGSNWTHDTYFTGATVTTNAHSINPPEIP